jgi:heme exporter protein D
VHGLLSQGHQATAVWSDVNMTVAALLGLVVVPTSEEEQDGS